MSILSLTKKEYEELDLIHSDLRDVHVNVTDDDAGDEDGDPDADHEDLPDTDIPGNDLHERRESLRFRR